MRLLGSCRAVQTFRAERIRRGCRRDASVVSAVKQCRTWTALRCCESELHKVTSEFTAAAASLPHLKELVASNDEFEASHVSARSPPPCHSARSASFASLATESAPQVLLLLPAVLSSGALTVLDLSDRGRLLVGKG